MIHHSNRVYRMTADGTVFFAVTYCGIESNAQMIADPECRIVAVDRYGTDETTDDGMETYCLTCERNENESAPSIYMTDETREELAAEIEAAPLVEFTEVTWDSVTDMDSANAWLFAHNYKISEDLPYVAAYVAGWLGSACESYADRPQLVAIDARIAATILAAAAHLPYDGENYGAFNREV